MSIVDVRRLTPDDVSDAMELVRQAGWNQMPADWRRLLDLEPAGCFAGLVDGDLVATATLLTYDGVDSETDARTDGPVATDIGWVGMVLVDEGHRRNGYGGAIVDRVLEEADDLGVAVGLDATESGRPLYRTRGFADVCPIERWAGTPTIDRVASDPNDLQCFKIDSTTIDDVCAFDRQACGVDRSDLLCHLLDESGVTGVGIRDGDSDDIWGYAVGRPGRKFGQVGPLIALSPSDVGRLLARASAPLEHDAVLVDLLAVDGVSAVLERLGMDRQRRLTRMTAPNPQRLLVGPDIVVAAGFELG